MKILERSRRMTMGKGKGWIMPYNYPKNTVNTTHVLWVDAQSGYDFCKKVGVVPEIQCGSLKAMTKEEQFDGKPSDVFFQNWVSVYITDYIEFTFYIINDEDNHIKWQELWRTHNGALFQ